MEHKSNHKIFPAISKAACDVSSFCWDISQNEELDFEDVAVQRRAEDRDKEGEDGVGWNDIEFAAELI